MKWKERKDASFSEEKEAKRLLFLVLRGETGLWCSRKPPFNRAYTPRDAAPGNKSLFASFSSEKEESCLVLKKEKLAATHELVQRLRALRADLVDRSVRGSAARDDSGGGARFGYWLARRSGPASTWPQIAADQRRELGDLGRSDWGHSKWLAQFSSWHPENARRLLMIPGQMPETMSKPGWMADFCCYSI
jgi:hypothetical protein